MERERFEAGYCKGNCRDGLNQDLTGGPNLMLECNFNSRLSIGYHEFTRLFSTFSYNTDYENPGVVLPVSK